MNRTVQAEEHVITAIRCALKGFPIFPVAEGGRPLTIGGMKEATTDIVQIAKWWTKWPTAHIGMVGSQSPVQTLGSDSESFGSIKHVLRDWRTTK